MIVSIHQPNYLPWSGFFHKMSLSDQFVLLDNVPFSKNSVQNRCRIKTRQGARWLTVHVLTKGRFGQATNLVEIADRSRWASKHWRTIEHNYAHAPHFGFMAECFQSAYEVGWEFLADVTIELITRAARALGIATPMVRASSLGVEGNRSDLLASICESLGASEYLSGPSGRDYLDPQPFQARGIAVSYHRFTRATYPQLHGEFVPALSIVDLLANCGGGSRQVLVDQGGRAAA